MKRKLAIFFLLAAMLATYTYAVTADVSVPSAILIERQTGKILFEKNAHEKLPPASVTKVMTLLLVMEALEDGRISMDDTVTASQAAANKGGSQVYLEENEQMSMSDMIKSVVVSSANDCACALAEHIAGSESAFVQMMNERAAALGMADTHFVNCTGLDDDPDSSEHLTTAYDIALMSRELLSHSEIRDYTTIWMDTIRNGTFGLSNTNKLIRFYDGATGLKTGYTSGAGFCLSASAERNGMELIAVVLHCDSSANRFESAKSLLNYGFSNYALISAEPEEPIPSVPVTLGTKRSVQPVLADQTPLLIDKSLAAGVTYHLSVLPSAEAPIACGQQLGTLTVCSGEKTLAELPLVSPEEIPALGFGDLFKMLFLHCNMS